MTTPYGGPGDFSIPSTFEEFEAKYPDAMRKLNSKWTNYWLQRAWNDFRTAVKRKNMIKGCIPQARNPKNNKER